MQLDYICCIGQLRDEDKGVQGKEQDVGDLEIVSVFQIKITSFSPTAPKGHTVS